MTDYLARLKTLLRENSPTRQTDKTTKGLLSGLSVSKEPVFPRARVLSSVLSVTGVGVSRATMASAAASSAASQRASALGFAYGRAEKADGRAPLTSHMARDVDD